MASDLTKYLGNKIARWLAGNDMPTAPADVYLALFDGDPRGAGTEVTTDIAAGGRLAITWAALAENDTDNELVSDADADFGASAGAVDFSHAAVFDASTSGNMLAAKALPGGPYSVAIGQNVAFLAGDLNFIIGT